MSEILKYQDSADKAFESFYSQPYRKRPTENDISHVKNIARSIMLHRDGIMKGGGFVTAVCNNNLEGAVSSADSVCIECLQFFVYCKQFIRP